MQVYNGYVALFDNDNTNVIPPPPSFGPTGTPPVTPSPDASATPSTTPSRGADRHARCFAQRDAQRDAWNARADALPAAADRPRGMAAMGTGWPTQPAHRRHRLALRHGRRGKQPAHRHHDPAERRHTEWQGGDVRLPAQHVFRGRGRLRRGHSLSGLAHVAAGARGDGNSRSSGYVPVGLLRWPFGRLQLSQCPMALRGAAPGDVSRVRRDRPDLPATVRLPTRLARSRRHDPADVRAGN